MQNLGFNLYELDNKQGWILSSFKEKKSKYYSPLLQFGRTNYQDPWQDPNFHSHTISLEIYLLIEGELWHIVNDIPIIMKGRSLLLVRPGVSHSIIGGIGKIQHIGMKIPHQNDEKIIDEKQRNIHELTERMKSSEIPNILESTIGYYVDLNKEENQNKWQLGIGHALYYTEEFCMAYVNFLTEEKREAVDHKDTYHYHKQSTEWYLTLVGQQMFLIADEIIAAKAGTLLRIHKGIPHRVVSRKYPFEGVTMRTPVVKDDKYVLEEK